MSLWRTPIGNAQQRAQAAAEQELNLAYRDKTQQIVLGYRAQEKREP